MDTESQVELLAIETHQSCSYCSLPEGSCESWLQGTRITPEHYQMLLDRGWRRIGSYICKPIADKACCPQYAIRCEALNYKLTKSQARVLRKMRKYLMTEGTEELEKWKSRERYRPAAMQKGVNPKEQPIGIEETIVIQDNNKRTVDPPDIPWHLSKKSKKLPPRSGLGPDPDKPLSIKSKVRKMNNRTKSTQQQLPQSCPDAYEILRSQIPHLNQTDNFKRELRVVLVPALEDDIHFQSTSRESFGVFKKFQTVVIKESESEWSFLKWSRCFTDCPVPHDFTGTGPGYGNFHQQYILDGKIIAVGVLTLIPNAVVTEYFYYDPDYGFLSLGIYSALNEICLLNELHKIDNRHKRYYLGAYTHLSPKMRYKISFAPAELLCPHTYKWIPLQECIVALESRTPRLDPGREDEIQNENESVHTTFDMDNLLVCYECNNITYRQYILEHYGYIDGGNAGSSVDVDDRKEELETLKQYVSRVGAKCATSIPLRVPVSLYPL